MRTVIAVTICLVVPSALHAAPPSPDFAALEHTTRPLVQEGSDNLLRMDAWGNELGFWRPTGDISVVEVDGGHRLRFGPTQDGAAGFHVYLPEPKGRTLYRFSFETRFSPDAKLDWDADYPGFHGWFAQAGEGGSLPGAVRMRVTRRTDDWAPTSFLLYTHPDATTVYVSLTLHATAGHALLRNVKLIEERVSAGEGRVVLETPSGEWAEVRQHTVTRKPSSALCWAVEDSDALRPYCPPESKDQARWLELAGAPGEMCVGAVAQWNVTGRAIHGIRPRLERLHSGVGGPGVLTVSASWKWIVFHPRRTDYYGRGRTFEYVPNLFVERPDGVDLPSEQTVGFWLNLRIPEDAKPGIYQGLFAIKSDLGEGMVPVRVRVYPFALAELPDKTRHLYLDGGGRWRDWTDEQMLAEIADVRDHGYESVPLSSGGEFVMDGGKVGGFTLNADALGMIGLAMRGGMRGPFGFWVGRWPRYLCEKLGLPADAIRGNADTWPAELADAMVDALKALKVALAAEGVSDPFIIAVDEPGYWKKGSPERYAWEMDCYARAGWDSYCTTSTAPPDPLGMHVTYHCYGGGRLTADPERSAEVAQLTRDQGQRLWYYCTGSYSGQIGNMVRNRYLAGFMFHRIGADGTASWTFQRARGDAFDDFQVDERGKPRNMQACVTYPDPEHEGRNLDTPTWEGLRQAWYDHRYAATLQREIDRVRGLDAAKADAAQARFDDLMGALPWNGDPFAWPEMSNVKLSATRAAIAEEIIKLQ